MPSVWPTQARFLRSNFYNQSHQAQDICPSRLFGETIPPQNSLKDPEKKELDNCTGNFNVNVFSIGGQMMLTSDFEGGEVLDCDTLTCTTRPHTWDDTWGTFFDKIAAAHPANIPGSDGSAVNFVMRINPAAMTGLGDHHLILYRVEPSSATRTVLRKIALKRLSYIHSFTVPYCQHASYPASIHPILSGCVLYLQHSFTVDQKKM